MKDKAKELIAAFGKELAVKVAEEMILEIRWNLSVNYEKRIEYWKQVKTEIEKYEPNR